MTIYFVTARELGLVKIGCTKDTNYRLHTLKTTSPAALKVEALLPGYYERERELHEQFAEHRVRGEWFKITEEIEEIICGAGPLLMPFEKPTERKRRQDTEAETERMILASNQRDREMLDEAKRIFARLGPCQVDECLSESRRFYSVVPASGGQFGQRFAVRGEGGHRHRLFGADLNLSWDQADRLCDILEEVRNYALVEGVEE